MLLQHARSAIVRAARVSGLLAGVGLAVLMSRTALAVDRTWSNAAGGNFFVGGNWSTGVAPRWPTTYVNFGLAGPYTVTMGASFANREVRVPSGTVTLAIAAGSTYTLFDDPASGLPTLSVGNTVLAPLGN